MKKIQFIFYTLILSAFTVKAQHSFTISGQLAADKKGLVFLDYNSNGKYIRDSAVVKNGSFTFKGVIGDPVYATLDLNPYKGNLTPEVAAQADFIKFFLEGATTVKSTAGLREAVIQGGPSQADYLKRDALFKPLNQQLAPLSAKIRQLYQENNTEAIKPVQQQIGELTKKAQQIDSAYIIEHPDSYVAFDIWRSKHKGFAKPEWRTEFERFSKRVKGTEEGLKIAARIAQAEKLTTGNVAPLFTLKDILGKEVSLTSLRGKNVLLCFWMRNFVNFEAFSLYFRRAEKRLKDKNTVFVAISYDDDETWKSAVAENFPNWINLKETDPNSSLSQPGKVAQSYGIYTGNSLPAAYLIGPDGKLLASRLVLNDTELGLKLEKLVK